MNMSRDEAKYRLEAALTKARMGDTKSASEMVADVRGSFEVDSVPGIAIRAILAESIIANYESDWSTASDRLLRARHLAKLFKEDLLHAFSLAWSAVVSFNQNNISDAVEFVARVFSSEFPRDAAIDCRAASLIGTMFQLSGSSKEAKNWFAVARRNAEIAAESALLSTVIFDSAAARVSNNRFDQIFRTENFVIENINIDDLFVATSINFDNRAGVEIMPRLHALLVAQSKRLRGANKEAQEYLKQFFSDSRSVPSRCVAQATVELALCSSGLSDQVQLRELINRVSTMLPELAESDEAAVAHYAMYELLLGLGSREAADSHLERAHSHAGDHQAWQRSLFGLLTKHVGAISTEDLLRPNAA